MRGRVVILLASAFLTGSAGLAEELVHLSPFVVQAQPGPGYEEGRLIMEAPALPARHGYPSVAERLDRLPQVSLQRRGLHAAEPVIQGMDGDRVATSLNGIYLPNAAPTLTGAPVNFLPDSASFRVGVLRSLPPVREGPVPTGSRIRIDSHPEGESPRSATGGLFDNPRGSSLMVEQEFRTVRAHARMGLHYAGHGDYQGGGGSGQVDADYRAWGGYLSGLVRPAERHLTQFAVLYTRQELARNPSLPLDTKDTPFYAVSLNHSIRMEAARLNLRAGYTRTDPYLTSEDRVPVPNAPLSRITASGEASSYTLGLNGSWEGFPATRASVGLDFTGQTRAMTRRRFLNTGTALEDLIWPDLQSTQGGAFFQLETSRKDGLQWRLGARADWMESEMGAPSAPVSGVPGARGGTVAENFVAYHGPDAAALAHTDSTGALNGLLWGKLSGPLAGYLGAGYTVAAPGLGERYRSLVNALGGGVELGNPTLQPERKTEWHAGLSWEQPGLTGSIEAFQAEADDYIQREWIAEDPRIYSFANRDARFRGLLATFELHSDNRTSASAWRVPLEFEYLECFDRSRGRRLPGIPPWSASLGLVRSEGDWEWLADRVQLSLYARYTASRSNPQPEVNPLFQDTEAHFLLDGEVHLVWTQRVSVRLLLSNLLDTEGSFHLQPPVATGAFRPSSGDLSGGDRIPFPGRGIGLVIGFEAW